MRFFITFMIFNFIFSINAYSQPVSIPISSQQNQKNFSLPNDNDSEMTVIKDDIVGKYLMADIENLSKLYWRLGAFDYEDKDSIEKYIKINDCKIFNNFSRNDFEWEKIMDTMRPYLKNNAKSFPLTYQFTLGLTLGKYDMQKGGFEIIDGTGFSNSRLINVATSDFNKEICNDNSIGMTYPKSVIILLSKPFDLNFISIDEHVAQAYILKKKQFVNREAFLRLRVTFEQYVGNLSGENNTLFSVLKGKVDGYEVFEDSGYRNILLSVDLNSSEDFASISSSHD